MFTVEEVNKKIAQGKRLLLACEESAIGRIDPGKWIAGTIPYFMTEDGGRISRDLIFCTELPDYVKDVSIKMYNEETLPGVYLDAPKDGFSFIIIPGMSKIHLSFANNATKYEKFAETPLVGWIAGIHLSDLGKITPKVVNGEKKQISDVMAVVMHATLPETMYADIEILNLFKQGDSDTIEVLSDGFNHQKVLVNGTERNLAEYVTEKNLDVRLPLVADYNGAMINSSFQTIDKEKKQVDFYAPLFQGIKYKQAKKVENYVTEFLAVMPKEEEVSRVVFSCNCILNFLYSELEGKKTGKFLGPMTFGEIAYQLLNQTLVYVTINTKSQR